MKGEKSVEGKSGILHECSKETCGKCSKLCIMRKLIEMPRNIESRCSNAVVIKKEDVLILRADRRMAREYIEEQQEVLSKRIGRKVKIIDSAYEIEGVMR